MAIKVNDYFGLCPHCRDHDGYINIGQQHWFFCRRHRTKWCFGSDIFSSWRDQTEDQKWARYYSMGFGDYTEVKPYFYPPRIGDRVRRFLTWPVRKCRSFVRPVATSRVRRNGDMDDEVPF